MTISVWLDSLSSMRPYIDALDHVFVNLRAFLYDGNPLWPEIYKVHKYIRFCTALHILSTRLGFSILACIDFNTQWSLYDC